MFKFAAPIADNDVRLMDRIRTRHVWADTREWVAGERIHTGPCYRVDTRTGRRTCIWALDEHTSA